MRLPFLVCPNCARHLSANKTSVFCTNSHVFAIDENVITFEHEYKVDKKYQWDTKLRNPNENLKLDTVQSGMAKSKTKRRLNNMIDYIVKTTPTNKNVYLDIVTGRGLFIRNFLPLLKNATCYLNDISTDVLVGTYQLITPLISTNTVIPIQTSATHLPFPDGLIPAITSFGPNNAIPFRESLQEIKRVLSREGVFVGSMTLYEMNSASCEYMKQTGEHTPFNTIEEWKPELEKMGFKVAQHSVLFDGSVDKVPLDILPRKQGERYQDIGFVLTYE